MLDIIILRRSSDYMAFLYGKKDIWEVGESEEEALGKLMISLYNRHENYILITRRIENE